MGQLPEYLGTLAYPRDDFSYRVRFSTPASETGPSPPSPLLPHLLKNPSQSQSSSNLLTLRPLWTPPGWLEAEEEQSPSDVPVDTMGGGCCLQPKCWGQKAELWREDRCRYTGRKTIISQKTCSCSSPSTGRRANPVKFPPEADFCNY